jgi:hypothetical protein
VSTNVVDTQRRKVPVRLRRLAPWIGGLLLVGGVVAAIVTFVPDRNPAPQASSPTPVRKPVKEKTVPLSAAETSVARQFLKTAVGRGDLASAWKIAGPNIRGGLTYKEWLTGNIPVVPYPIKSLATARFKIDYSYRNRALLEVALLPKPGANIKPQVFYLGLKRVPGPGGKRHWVVDNWVPRTATLVPRAP